MKNTRTGNKDQYHIIVFPIQNLNFNIKRQHTIKDATKQIKILAHHSGVALML